MNTEELLELIEKIDSDHLAWGDWSDFYEGPRGEPSVECFCLLSEASRVRRGTTVHSYEGACEMLQINMTQCIAITDRYDTLAEEAASHPVSGTIDRETALEIGRIAIKEGMECHD